MFAGNAETVSLLAKETNLNGVVVGVFDHCGVVSADVNFCTAVEPW